MVIVMQKHAADDRHRARRVGAERARLRRPPLHRLRSDRPRRRRQRRQRSTRASSSCFDGVQEVGARQRAVQALQPHVPPREDDRQRARRRDRRQRGRGHGRTVHDRERAAAVRDGAPRGARRRARPARRRLQAAHLAVRVSGDGRRGIEAAARRRRREQHGHDLRGHGDLARSKRCCEYVDILQVGARNMQNFNLLVGPRPDPQADPAQARHVRHDSGVAAGRRNTSCPAATTTSSSASAASARSRPTRATRSTSPPSRSSTNSRTCRSSPTPRTPSAAATK